MIFTNIALQKAGVTCQVQVVKDGREALDYLNGDGKFADRDLYPIPYRVLLDLKLPFVMGLDILKWLRARPEFDGTIVLVLSLLLLNNRRMSARPTNCEPMLFWSNPPAWTSSFPSCSR